MSIPDGPFGVIALIALLIPGLVYGFVRTTIRGYSSDDKSIDARIARAVTISILLDAVYLVVAFPIINGSIETTKTEIRFDDPFRAGAIVLVCAILIPGALATAFNLRLEKYRIKGKRLPRFALDLPFRSVPTAWDHANTRRGSRMVRVRLADGTWLGGWWGPGSYVSTFPEPRDIYLTVQYRMTGTGEFRDPIPDADGLWIPIVDGTYVEFIRDTREAPEND